ncbi:MAG: hypothetical protein AAGI23_00700 [Bacteroidota bacterium]
MKEKKDNIKIPKSKFQEWLEQLQQESWQLELLISGFALFAIWESRTLIDDLDIYRQLHRGTGGITDIVASTLRLLLPISWRIFFFNLLIHVIVRGLWIGAIGLRYVSSDIDYENLNYSEIFSRFLRRKIGAFDDYIEKLERFSSVLFAYTFLLFFIFLSLIFYFFLLAVLMTLFKADDMTMGFTVMFYLLFGFIPFIDFVSMGGIKRIKEKNIARIYFVIYRVFSVLTLSFIYRPLLYNFLDEKYTRRLFLISIPYILAIILIPTIKSDATPFFPMERNKFVGDDAIQQETFSSHFYDDERMAQKEQRVLLNAKSVIRGISLPSIELSGNYAWFFLRSYPSDNEWIEQQIPPYRKLGITINGNNSSKLDTLYQKIQDDESREVAAVIRKRRELRKAIEAGTVEASTIGVINKSGEIELDNRYWKNQRDSVDQYWEAKKGAYRTDKLNRLKATLLSVATITIDDIPYTDSCDCKFYLHPNVGEKGLRCYFPINNLAFGAHQLHLERQFYDDESEEFYTTDYFVPFYKVENND